MERLTIKLPGGYAMAEGYELDTLKGVREVVNRLAAYENSGLEPEEIVDLMGAHATAISQLTEYRSLSSLDRLRELAQAARGGKLGIPPVKLHQNIFRIFNGEIREEVVCDAMWEPFKPRPRWKVWVMGGGLPYYWDDVFGITVFSAREDAKEALKARGRI